MSRLEKVIGTEIIHDIRLGHTFFEVNILKEFIKEQKPDWFFEIGLHEGGLSYLLIPEFPKLNYLGVELYRHLVRPKVIELYNSDPLKELYFGDCFDQDLLTGIAKQPNKIIYCDGGNKPKELMFFKSACNVGDIIMAHDYYNGTRNVRGVPEEIISKEVLPMDIADLEADETFARLPEQDWK